MFGIDQNEDSFNNSFKSIEMNDEENRKEIAIKKYEL